MPYHGDRLAQFCGLRVFYHLIGKSMSRLLALTHFWTAQISFVGLVAGLWIFYSGETRLEPVAAISALAYAASFLVFAAAAWPALHALAPKSVDVLAEIKEQEQFNQQRDDNSDDRVHRGLGAVLGSLAMAIGSDIYKQQWLEGDCRPYEVYAPPFREQRAERPRAFPVKSGRRQQSAVRIPDSIPSILHENLRNLAWH
jgi:hypothetical protein